MNAIMIEQNAMLALNSERESLGHTLAYSEKDFYGLQRRMISIANELSR